MWRGGWMSYELFYSYLQKGIMHAEWFSLPNFLKGYTIMLDKTLLTFKMIKLIWNNTTVLRNLVLKFCLDEDFVRVLKFASLYTTSLMIMVCQLYIIGWGAWWYNRRDPELVITDMEVCVYMAVIVTKLKNQLLINFTTFHWGKRILMYSNGLILRILMDEVAILWYFTKLQD